MFCFSWLDEDFCRWHGVVCELSSLKVVDLYLSNNNLVGTLPSTFGKLSSLKVLHLQNNQLSGTVPFLEFQPDVLYLQENQLEGSLPLMASYESLLRVNYSSNSFYGNIPPFYSTAKNLQSFLVNSNMLTGTTDIVEYFLDSLRTCDLRHNNFDCLLVRLLLSLTLTYFLFLSLSFSY